jgi:hypothetical protein
MLTHDASQDTFDNINQYRRSKNLFDLLYVP